MENTLHLPKHYSPMSEQEMTYTSGGAVTISDLGLMAAFSVAAYSYVWGLNNSRRWLRANKKRPGSTFQILNRAFDAVLEDMSKSIWNTLWDGFTAANMVALWPITLVALITA